MDSPLARLIDKATSLCEQGQLEFARPLWQKVCELDPGTVDHWLVISAIDEQLGFFTAALDHLKYAFLLEPKDPDIWSQAAALHWKMRSYDHAFQNIHTGLALDFTREDLRSTAANWLMRVHQFEHALVHFNFLSKTQKLSPQDLTSALSCAYLTVDLDSIAAYLKLDRERVISTKTLPKEIAECIASIVPPSRYRSAEKLDELNAEVNSFIDQIQLELSALNPESIQQFYNQIAHTEDALISKATRNSHTTICEIITSKLALRAEVAPGVLELGCGVGSLGSNLYQAMPRSVITGVDFSDNALSVASKKNSYANLLSWPQWQKHCEHLFEQYSFVLISHRFQHYIQRHTVLNEIVRTATSVKTIFIELLASPDSDSIQAEIESLSSEWAVEQSIIDKSTQHTLLCLSYQPKGLSNNAIDLTSDELADKTGNQLIQAQQLLDQGLFEDANKIADEVLEHYPQSGHAYFIKGISAQHNKQHPLAIGYLRQAHSRCYGYIDAWFQMATVWQALNRFNSMLRCYRQCLKFCPNHIFALRNLISFFALNSNWEMVFHYLRTLLLHHPLNQELIKYADELVKQANRGELNEPYSQFKKSKEWKEAQLRSALDNQYFDRCKTLLKSLDGQCEPHEIQLFQISLLEKSGELTEAISLLKQLLTKDQDNLNYLKQLRSLVLATGDLKETQEIIHQLVSLSDTSDGDLQSNLFVANYFDFCSDENIKDYHFEWGKGLSKALESKKCEIQVSNRTENHPKKIRIGYVSGDFKMHSVSMFLYNIYKNHDRTQFEIVSYSTLASNDPMTTKLRLFSHLWRDISKSSDQQAAQQIRRDNIDILVDLSGNTGHNKLPLFCLKPAPVQCSYLGYANTTGLTQIDYRLTDDVADPEGLTDHLHTETLIRLPNGFLSYSRHFGSSTISIAPHQNKQRNYTFVCCNNVHKVNSSVVRVFAKILQKVEGSTLLIKAHNLNNPDIISRYQNEFEEHGITAGRVHLMNALDLEDHQELYNHTKIALDPFPYSGTTTSCDALWMGVPVLTYAGSRHSTRVTASILTRIGLDDWIANSEQSYIDKAVKFANDPACLERLKLSIRHTLLNSSLMNPTTVCKDIEVAYQSIWKQHLESLL